jgi:outer membrane biosynthesis protein TonB
MIRRFLVPLDARPPAADAATQRRRPTTLDERTLVPAMLPIVHLDGHSNIPSSLPLESISARVVVPRDLNWEAFAVEEKSSLPPQPTELDARIAVPLGASPPETIEASENIPLDLIEADIFLTGEVNLLSREPAEHKVKAELVTRVSSVVFHILVIAFVLFEPKLFPPHQPTQEQLDLARRQIMILLPPGALDAPKIAPRTKDLTSEKMHVDPRILRQIAPPEPQPLPKPPEPERVVKELPNAPVPKPNVAQSTPQPVAKADAPKPPLKLETPDQQPTTHALLIPKSSSPGRAIEDSLRAAAKAQAPTAIAGGGQLPSSDVPGGGGQGTAYGAMELLTPTEGVDFSNYLARVYTSVKQNWFAVMPESVRLGDKGIVVLQFKIMRNGNVPTGEPVLLRYSGKEPLDRAAVSSIRASNPFPPLPSAFSGPYIELRFGYYYNLPIDYGR